ncbi:Aspartate/ornithine carbamoyltransferase [Lipomyces japonicus]|uniref:Aspartate/ornithine carbamoyltransferase n=1 Tax=Lipomyces japonicus TaxID=56871 RepID=UPI0034CD41BD
MASFRTSISSALKITKMSFSTSTRATASTSSSSSSSNSPRHLLTIGDLSASELNFLVNRASQFRKIIKSNSLSTQVDKQTLLGHTVALIFSKRSTRTRVSSEAAINYLGGHPMFLGKDDIQLGVNESLYDTSRVISSMTSSIVARVGPHSDIAGLAAASSVPVINALCDTYHPLQAIADILTIKEAFGPELRGLKLAWVGDSNNVLNDLAIACAKTGINLSVATPDVYPVNQAVFDVVRQAAAESGSTVQVGHEPKVAVKDADVIVTDTWISMGQESEKQLRLKQFAGYQVTTDLATSGGAKQDWKFMHCLPRKQEEVSDEVFYSDRSLVFDEAENRLYAMLAALDGFVVKKGKLE